MFKKFFMIMALVMVAALSFNTVTADASTNCIGYASKIYWTGQLTFNATVNGCTDTDYMEFDNLRVGYDGIWDATVGYFHSAGSCYQCGVVFPVGAPNTGWSKQITYGTNAWCGGAVRDVSAYFYFRLHNSITHTWGSYRRVGGTYYEYINC